MVITITATSGRTLSRHCGAGRETLKHVWMTISASPGTAADQPVVRVAEHDGKMQAAGDAVTGTAGISSPYSGRNTEHVQPHLMQLIATISSLMSSLPPDAETILYRLYHEEDVVLCEPAPVAFHCGCSRERCADTLVTLPEEDVNHIFREDGKIDMES